MNLETIILHRNHYVRVQMDFSSTKNKKDTDFFISVDNYMTTLVEILCKYALVVYKSDLFLRRQRTVKIILDVVINFFSVICRN